jgi:putative ATP-dependent endonuclease of OLD family
MRLRTIEVKGLRCLADVSLHCSNLTAIVGRNGVGKSTLLQALRLFYEPAQKVSEEDFLGRDTTTDLAVALTFDDLSVSLKTRFREHVMKDVLRIEKVVTWEEGRPASTYFGTVPRNPEFRAMRDALAVRDRGVRAKSEYSQLQAGRYSMLPEWTTLEDARTALDSWESNNATACQPGRDSGDFFGFGNETEGDLTNVTRLLYIPAVNDAQGMLEEGRDSVFSELLDLVVRGEIAEKPKVIRAQKEIARRLRAVMSPKAHPELQKLQKSLAKSLKIFVPNSDVVLDWHALDQFELPMPTANVELVEDEYQTSVDRCGQGLQRAFVMSMLRQLTVAQSQGRRNDQQQSKASTEHLFLVIEEPEVYQHPNRQRHFARILRKLAEDRTPGFAKTQVLYATHSPLFVGIDRIDEIRLMRKPLRRGSAPRTTQIVAVDLDKVAGQLWDAAGRPGPKYTGASLKPRLVSLMTPWVNEGFFADTVVLVEGEDDRAAILGAAEAEGHDFEAMSIAVLPCGGKTNLDRPTAIFRHLGIQTYTIWDSDEGGQNARPDPNHLLLRLLGAPTEDWPCDISRNFACFRQNLESTLRDELGNDNLEEILAELVEQFAFADKKQALKNPSSIALLLQAARARNLQCRTLSRIVDRIVSLSRQLK